MNAIELTRLAATIAELCDNFHSLTIDDVDFLVPTICEVDERLLSIMRESKIPC
tara:strand:+ start:252 stop:413 length:162 start_codon:yes stop_codon:yes gene_type:complete